MHISLLRVKVHLGAQEVIITLSNHFSGPEMIAMTKLMAMVKHTSTSIVPFIFWHSFFSR